VEEARKHTGRRTLLKAGGFVAANGAIGSIQAFVTSVGTKHHARKRALWIRTADRPTLGEKTANCDPNGNIQAVVGSVCDKALGPSEVRGLRGGSTPSSAEHRNRHKANCGQPYACARAVQLIESGRDKRPETCILEAGQHDGMLL